MKHTFGIWRHMAISFKPLSASTETYKYKHRALFCSIRYSNNRRNLHVSPSVDQLSRNVTATEAHTIIVISTMLCCFLVIIVVLRWK